MSNISRSNRLPLSSRGAQHLWSSCPALQSTPGAFWIRWHICEGPWPASLFLHVTPLCNPRLIESPLREDSPFAPTHPGRAEQPTKHLFPAVWLAPSGPWLAGGPSLLLGHCQSAHPWGGGEIEFPSPVGHLFLLLHVGVDPLINMGFPCLLGRVAARLG